MLTAACVLLILGSACAVMSFIYALINDVHKLSSGKVPYTSKIRTVLKRQDRGSRVGILLGSGLVVLGFILLAVTMLH
jgi:hypothetical protein